MKLKGGVESRRKYFVYTCSVRPSETTGGVMCFGFACNNSYFPFLFIFVLLPFADLKIESVNDFLLTEENLAVATSELGSNSTWPADLSFSKL